MKSRKEEALLKLVKLLKESGQRSCNLVIRESAVFVELQDKNAIYIPIASGYPFSFIVVDVEKNEIRKAHDFNDTGSVFNPPEDLMAQIVDQIQKWFTKVKPSNWLEIYKV